MNVTIARLKRSALRKHMLIQKTPEDSRKIKEEMTPFYCEVRTFNTKYKNFLRLHLVTH